MNLSGCTICISFISSIVGSSANEKKKKEVVVGYVPPSQNLRLVCARMRTPHFWKGTQCVWGSEADN